MREAYKAWNVLFTLPRQERGAATKLEQQGFETFLPMFRRPEKRRSERNEVLAPLFPRYLFTRTSEQIWGAGRTLPEIVMVLRQSVPAEAIAHLRAVNENPFDETVAPLNFPLGSRLQITEGPFIGLTGNLRSTDPIKRLAVLDCLLGTVSVDVAILREAV